MYNLYQPKKPTDDGLFAVWKTYLKKKNVDIMLSTSVESLKITNNILTGVNISDNNLMYSYELTKIDHLEDNGNVYPGIDKIVSRIVKQISLFIEEI